MNIIINFNLIYLVLLKIVFNLKLSYFFISFNKL